MSTKRQTATDGTQAHRDLATVKNNINYWIKVHGMDREEAKARVNQPSYVMMDAQTINREVAAEAKRQANLKARQEREAEQQRKEAEAEQQRKDQEQQRKEEPKTDESKGEKKINQRQIGITVNGVVYQSICKGMAAVGIQDKGTKNWFKIRADLKKSGISIFGEFTFIQL